MSEFGPGYNPDEGENEPREIELNEGTEGESVRATEPPAQADSKGSETSLSSSHPGEQQSELSVDGRAESSEARHSPEATETANEIITQLSDLYTREQGFLMRIESVYDKRAQARLAKDDSRALIDSMMETGLNVARALELATMPQIRRIWESAHEAWEAGKYDRLSPEELALLKSEFRQFVEEMRAKQDTIEQYVAAQETGADFLEAIQVFGTPAELARLLVERGRRSP